MYLIPQTATLTPFKAHIPAISHCLRFGFSPEKREKVLNISNRFSMDCAPFKKNVASSASYISYFEDGSNISMKSYAETGSPWKEPLSKLKY